MQEHPLQAPEPADAGQWADLLHMLFPDNIPAVFKWSTAADIAFVLARIAASGASRAYAPDGRLLTLSAARLAAEPGCLAIETGDCDHILRPARLVFEVVNDTDLRWAWFRLEARELPATGMDPRDADCGFEQLLEVAPGEYISRRQPAPAGARPVTRHLGGMFIFLAQASPYQLGQEAEPANETGQAGKMSKTAFRKALSKMADILFKTANP